MTLSWQFLNELAMRYGDPFYLVDLAKFQTNYQEFLAAFRTVYAKTQLAYSYKTNYTPRLCQLVNHMGGYAEVVSWMEYELARRVGVPAKRIIFNGPFKRPAHMAHALCAGSIVNLDSFYEVEVVEQVAKDLPNQRLMVGLRCNFDTGGATVSRFGFDVARPEFQRVLQTLRTLDNCWIAGLHCHFLTPLRSAESYGQIARQMLELAATHFAEGTLRFIDVGGGFFSKMSEMLQKQFGYPIPSYAEYGQAIAAPFTAAFPDESGPELILEPGIALTADIMQFVAQVIDVKTVRGRNIALLSGSIYEIKPMLNTRNLPVTLLRQNEKSQQTSAGRVDLVGYTCMENDCLYSGFEGTVDRGDYVVFDNVGAYTNVLKPPFINPAPPMISYNADTEQFALLRRREEVDDIFSTYISTFAAK